MALELVNSGPKMDWTMDTKIYDRYLQWKYSVELIFSSALSKATPAEKSSYIRLWMGPEAMPLIQKWTSTGKIDFSTPEEIPGAGGRARVTLSNGFIIQTFWDLLEEELKPKGNKLISILELLSDKSKQGSKPLNDWLSYVYNLVETCNYGVSRDRIIRDILFKGCASAKAKDTIIRRGDQISLADVIEILQTEDATNNTHETIKEIDSTTRMDPVASVHYASYENNKKSKKKHHSTEQNTPSNNSTKSSKSCFRCGKPYFQGHDAECKAIGATCNECFKTGHFQIVCGSLGRLPRRVQKSNSTDRKTAQQHSISDAPAQAPVGFYNEQGNWVAEPPRPSPTVKSMCSLSVVHPVIQDIQDIHPEIDPELLSTQGMSQSQISFRKNSKTFDSSRDAVSNRSGSDLQAFPMRKQPMRQNSTKSSSSSVLQVSKQSQRDQDIQNSTNVSVQSFRDTETDPETTFNAETGDSKKFQVSNFRNDLQRKGEVMLCLPIDSTQFQQFCKKLNDKELFLCRDLLEKEIYGK